MKFKNASPLDIFFFTISDTFKIFCKYPVLALPLLISWIIYAYIAVYFQFDFNTEGLTVPIGLVLVFLIILIYCILFSIGSFIMLEMIEHIETGKQPNFFKALSDTFIKNFIKALPIMIVWAIIWFFVEVIEALTRNKNRNDDNDENSQEKSYKNIAKTISGYQELSLRTLTFDLIQSGVRMVVFYIYPAIAWEDETTLNAVKKGFAGIKSNALNFVTSFFTIEMVTYFIFLPAVLMIWFADEFNINYSELTWRLLIIYIACSFAYYLYLQQMSAAILYMWNMKWQKAVQDAIKEGREVPKLEDIKRPDLLDDIPDLLILKK